MPRILATECVCAPAIASTLFIRVADASAFRFHFGAAWFFAATGFIFVALCKALFAEGFEAPAALFVVALAPAFTLAPACVFVLLFALLARTWVAGARCTGSLTARLRCGPILLDDRWFQRRRSSTDTLNRSATVTSVSPARVV